MLGKLNSFDLHISGQCPTVSCTWAFGDRFSNQPLNGNEKNLGFPFFIQRTEMRSIQRGTGDVARPENSFCHIVFMQQKCLLFRFLFFLGNVWQRKYNISRPPRHFPLVNAPCFCQLICCKKFQYCSQFVPLGSVDQKQNDKKCKKLKNQIQLIAKNTRTFRLS